MKAKFGERSSLYTEDLLKSSDYATTADSTEFSWVYKLLFAMY